jgi:roadblock/LC7 domain-containing protein
MAAQFCAAVSIMLNSRASSFADRSGMNWVPQHGWAYSGGEWTACIGDGGRRGVFVERSKADFNELFEDLGVATAEDAEAQGCPTERLPEVAPRHGCLT